MGVGSGVRATPRGELQDSAPEEKCRRVSWSLDGSSKTLRPTGGCPEAPSPGVDQGSRERDLPLPFPPHPLGRDKNGPPFVGSHLPSVVYLDIYK